MTGATVEPSEAVKRFKAILERRPDLDAIQIFAHSTLAKSTCYHWLSGTKKLGPAIDAELARVVRLVEQGDILQAGTGSVTVTTTESPRDPRRVRRARDFYLTGAVRSVVQVLNYCVDQAVIGCITGDYGAGKTEAVRHWRASNDGRKANHLTFEFDEFTSHNVTDFISCLCQQIQIDPERSHTAAGRNMRAAIKKLEEEAPILLIFDQCEACSPRVLQVIRQIWDRTRHAGVGVVLLASPLLALKLQASRAKDLGALTSRIAVWAQIEGLGKEEITDILRQEGISNIDDAGLQLLTSAIGGSMRRLMAVTDLLIAKHANKPITAHTIEGVASNLWGLNIAGKGNTK